jgi:hypothetical protein
MHRIYIDSNDMSQDGWCHIAVFEGRDLDEAASELGLIEGMPVILYYEDPAEVFEFGGTVHFRDGRWTARANLDSYRLISQTPLDELRKLPGFKV